MKKLLNVIAIALVLASLTSVATPVLAHSPSDPYVAQLMIKTGKGDSLDDFTQIGTVKVWNVGYLLYVTFTADVGSLVETHLYVGTEAPARGNPGQFPYASQETYVITLATCTGEVFIAAHAVVCGETAWAYGPCGVSSELPGKWGWYFSYVVQ